MSPLVTDNLIVTMNPSGLKLYAKCFILPWFHIYFNILTLLSFHEITSSILDAVYPQNVALGQITRRLFAEHTCYIRGNPLGTAGSFMASGVNKRAAAHMQGWCRRDGPSQPGGRQQGVT